ncbi:MAG: rRNA maturation RNase YbeY [Desulfobacteraceae bacterium]|jgi:probable rRNA maturation factor
MAILIENQQKNHPVKIQNIKKKAQAILNALDCHEGELSILIVDDPRIEELNRAYLNHAGPTNVISFAMQEGEHGGLNPYLLGDVVISMDTCAREAEDAGMPIDRRFDQLLIHGILHIFGYDHIHSEDEAGKMEAKSETLLKHIEKMTL